MPLTRLNSVVLPAPFGPITEWIAPSRTVNDDVLHRVDAAEALAEVFDRQHHLLLVLRARRRCAMLGTRPFGMKIMVRHQDHAEHHHFPAFERLQQLRQDGQQRGADDRAEHRRHAAHHHHRHQLDRVEEAGHAGRDEADVVRADRAGDAGHHRRQHEHAHLEPGGVDAGDARGDLGTVDRLQRAADRRIDQVQRQPGHQQQQHGRHHVPAGFAGHRQAGQRERRHRHAIRARRSIAPRC